MPVIVLSEELKLAINLLNANTPGTDGTLSPAQEKFVSAELSRLIIYADATVNRLINQLKGNALRESQLVFTNGVAHGASVVPGGPIETIQAVITQGPYAGTIEVDPWPKQMITELERENRNPQLLTLIEPHCIVDGNVIYHNRAGLLLAALAAGALTPAVSFNVRHPKPFAIDMANCQAPGECARAVACLALSMAQPKDGIRIESAQLFKGMANDELEALGIPKAEAA